MQQPEPGATNTRAHQSIGARARRLLVALACIAALVAATTPIWWRLEGPFSPLFWVGIAGGAALLLAGLIGSRWRSSRAVADLLLIAATLYFIAYLGFSGNDAIYTLGLTARNTWFVVAGHAVVAFPEGRLRSRFERVVVLGMYAWTVGFRMLLPWLDPRLAGCDDCPRHILLIEGRPDVMSFVITLDHVLPVVATAAVLLVLTRRWLVATNPERRVLAPVYLALAINVVTAVGLFVTNTLILIGAIPAEAGDPALVVDRTALALIPLGIAVGMVRSITARAAVGNLLVRIAAGRTPEDLERDIAWAIGDPGLVLAVRKGGATSFVDADGHSVDVTTDRPGRRAVTLVTATGEDEVALLHDRSLLSDQPELLEAVVAATRLALENGRLQDEVALIRDIPAGLAERLMREGRQVGTSELRTVSILMSDIRDYSTIAEHADPVALAAQLNGHRTAMSRVITEHDGTVMQYVGDSVFAVFGAPVPLVDHAVRAVEAASEMQQAQRAMNEAWQADGLPIFRLGIAVTTGDVAAGLLGPEEHIEYSVVGDVVNLAQRIQAWAAAGEVVVDEATYARAGLRVRGAPLPPQRVKGRDAMVIAYRISPIA